MDSRPHSLAELTETDGFILSALCFGLAMASCSGTGGGSLCIPILILFLHFNSTQAIPLGNITVLGSALSNLLFNMRQRHPAFSSRSLIDWDMVGMMEPATMLGALFGAYIHKIMSPEWTVNLLVVLLSVTAARMLYKSLYGMCASTDFLRSSYDSIEDEHVTAMINAYGSVASLLVDADERFDYDLDSLSARSCQPHNVREISAFSNTYKVKNGASKSRLERKLSSKSISDTPYSLGKRVLSSALSLNTLSEVSRHTTPTPHIFVPKDDMYLLLALFVGACGLNISKAQLASSLGMTDQTEVGFLNECITFVLVIYIIVFGYLLSRNIISRYSDIHTATNAYGEINWNYMNMAFYSALCFVAGVMSGTFGIGGGTILAPLMIEIGMHPQATAATSSGMVFFTSIIAATSYLVDNALIPDYGALMFGLGILSNFIAQLIISPLVTKYGNPSMITGMLGLVITFTAVLMIVEAWIL